VQTFTILVVKKITVVKFDGWEQKKLFLCEIVNSVHIIVAYEPKNSVQKLNIKLSVI